MTFKLLTSNDAVEYHDHLQRVYDLKGLMSHKDSTWVEASREEFVQPDKIFNLLADNRTRIWATYEDGKIAHSMRTEKWKMLPIFTIVNFKSESISPFNVRRHLFPLWEVVLSAYENNRHFTSYLVRPLVWTKNRRTPSFESVAPVNRYHTLMEEVIPANTPSSNPGFDKIAGGVYPIDVVVISMHLRQEFRTFDGNEQYFL